MMEANASVVGMPQPLPRPTFPLGPGADDGPGGQAELTVVDSGATFLDHLQESVKRVVDLTVAVLALLLLLPVFAVIALAIKLSSPGPIFFRQVRIGRGGEAFYIYKFRTMTARAESYLVSLRPLSDLAGPLFKMHEDPRITGPGRFLRRFSLDELPQLINVVRGDMALVGPRPFVPAESEAFQDWSKIRFTMRPGITGHWQTSGRSDLPFEELKRLDCEYVTNWSLWWDMRILARTPLSVIKCRGAY